MGGEILLPRSRRTPNDYAAIASVVLSFADITVTR
jgi:hypothetical protein